MESAKIIAVVMRRVRDVGARWEHLLIRRGLVYGPRCDKRSAVSSATLRRAPVVELDRAVALSFAEGPRAALEIVDALESELAGYHLLASVRADLLLRLGRNDEAKHELERAASMTGNAREKALLLRERAAKIDG